MRRLALLLALALLVPAAALARPLPVALAPNLQLDVPAEITVIPCVPDMKLLPPGIKTYEPQGFERAESQAAKGFWLKPGSASDRTKPIYEYLIKSTEFIDSIKLRHQARALKAMFLEKAGGQNADLKKYAAWYQNSLRVPVPLLIDVGFGSGPAMGPIPCAMKVTDKLKEILKPCTAADPVFFSTVMLIEDIKDIFDCSAAVTNDTLALVFCHENAHGMMFDMYGSTMDRIQKISNVGHDSAVVSDRGLAYIEGWAECFEALYGPENPLLKLKPEEREKYHLSEFLFGRQDPVRRQRYIWAFQDQKTGMLKTGDQILATEGCIAGVFYDLLTSRAIKDPFTKAMTVMFVARPGDMAQFLGKWTEFFPDDKKVVLRIFLENTNYATASNECRKLYYDYYQAKLKYVKKQMPEAEFQAKKKAWETEKESVFAKVFADPKLMAVNCGADLWLTVTLETSKFKGLRLNMNTAPPNYLMAILGLTQDEALKFMVTRSAMGFFPGTDPMKPLTDVLGAERAQAVVAAGALKPVSFAPTNDGTHGWLRVVTNIPEASLQRLAAMQKQEESK